MELYNWACLYLRFVLEYKKLMKSNLKTSTSCTVVKYLQYASFF